MIGAAGPLPRPICQHQVLSSANEGPTQPVLQLPSLVLLSLYMSYSLSLYVLLSLYMSCSLSVCRALSLSVSCSLSVCRAHPSAHMEG